VRRLPDSPERIARGVWAGVFTTFTPFYAMHFVVAALIARLINGNILAALSGTFFGNPLTYVPIGIAALQTGHWMLGTEFDEELDTSLVGKVIDAGKDLTDHLFALFRDQPADWDGLHLFYDEVFFPYLVGGIVPGVITATICYMVSLPVIRAYQQHRRSRIKAKFDAIKKRAEMEAAGITPVAEPKKLKPKLTLPRVRKVK
jgi:uncharacterized protein (DUF2062 family)